MKFYNFSAARGAWLAFVMVLTCGSCAYARSGFGWLKPDEQFLLVGPSTVEVRNGPGVVFYPPLITRAIKRKGVKLDERQYMIVRDDLTAVEKAVGGPVLYFLGAHEIVVRSASKVVLEKDQYVRLRDDTSGDQRQVRGPAAVFPRPSEQLGDKQKALKLSEDEYAIATDRLSGSQWVLLGPQLAFPQTPYEAMSPALTKLSLKKHEFAKLADSASGEIRVVSGPAVVVPTPTESVLGAGKRAAFELQAHQYVKLLDASTGVVRVERGESVVIPSAHEEPVTRQCYGQDEDEEEDEDASTAVCDAINVDAETAVLVLDKHTAQQRLVTERGQLVPEPLEDIVEVRKLVRVEPHQVAIVRDNEGAFHFHAGESAGTAFFLQPHTELVTMQWSSGTSAEDLSNNLVKNAKQVRFKVPVQLIDLRSQYAMFEYAVRTSDNVELLIEGTIDWQVVDVPTMIERTGDPKGDVWYRARSAIIQAVSKVTLEEFMASFNEIVERAAEADDDFYARRGVRLHALEVVRYECVDQSTAKVLQEIIQETTNRINRMQKQKSENEVEHERMSAQIEIETQRRKLIVAQTENEKLRSSAEGEAEGTRLAQQTSSFLTLLNESMPDEAARLELLRFFKEQQTLTEQTANLAQGEAKLFLTPQDVNLKLQM